MSFTLLHINIKSYFNSKQFFLTTLYFILSPHARIKIAWLHRSYRQQVSRRRHTATNTCSSPQFSQQIPTPKLTKDLKKVIEEQTSTEVNSSRSVQTSPEMQRESEGIHAVQHNQAY